MIKKILIYGFLLLLICSGCNSANSQEIQPTTTELPTSKFTSTNEPNPTSTYTNTLEPSNTPTITLQPTNTPTQTPWRSYKIIYTLTRDNFSALWMPIPKNWEGIGMKDVEILSISPEPDDLFEDVQGNLIAYWSSGFKGSYDYVVEYNIKLSPINYQIDIENIKDYDTTNWEYQRYTQPSKLIQSDDEKIIALAKEIVGSEENPYNQAKLIHSWVSTNIKPGDIADALTTLEKGTAGCGGHSWLFIALLRSLGIPARGIGGLHTGYQSGFTNGNPREGTLHIHIWSEFYIPEYGWIQCDTSGGTQNFAQVNEMRIVLFRGEDIELGYNYPLDTVPWFHTPNEAIIGDSTPPTQTWGMNLYLEVEQLP